MCWNDGELQYSFSFALGQIIILKITLHDKIQILKTTFYFFKQSSFFNWEQFIIIWIINDIFYYYESATRCIQILFSSFIGLFTIVSITSIFYQITRLDVRWTTTARGATTLLFVFLLMLLLCRDSSWLAEYKYRLPSTTAGRIIFSHRHYGCERVHGMMWRWRLSSLVRMRSTTTATTVMILILIFLRLFIIDKSMEWAMTTRPALVSALATSGATMVFITMSRNWSARWWVRPWWLVWRLRPTWWWWRW